MASCDHHHDKFVAPMDFSAQNLSATWEIFKDQFEIFLLAKDMSEKPENVKIANLLMKMGPESVPIMNQFTWNTETKTEGDPPATTSTVEEKTLEKVLKKFAAHFRPVKNVIFERVRFNQLCQLQGQSIHDYITTVKSHADNCDYGEMKQELVRDKIVVGLRDPELRLFLINLDQELTLEICVRKAKQWVMHQSGLANMKPTSPVGQEIDAMAHETKARASSKQNYSPKPKTKNSASACLTCGRPAHSQGFVCPATRYNIKCFKCSKTGHYGKVCPARAKSSVASVDETEEFNMLDSL